MLPVLNVYKQKIEIPVINKTYTIRPYLVGEEKGLLMAFESKDEKLILNAVKNLIQNCIEEKISIDEMSTFELEFIFLQLRKISVNNIVEIGLKHQNDTECDHVQKVQIDLDQLKHTGKLNNKIVLDVERNIGVLMKMPTSKMLSKTYSTETEKVFGLIQNCISAIFDNKEVYYTKEISEEELTQWVNSLNNNQIKKIAEFFSTLPSLYYDVEYKCDKCGKIEKIKLEGLNNFL